MENFDHILLFKTDIKSEACKVKLAAVLNNFEEISEWNVALDDEDFVLRIVSYTLNHQQIITLINNHGHYCCELV